MRRNFGRARVPREVAAIALRSLLSCTACLAGSCGDAPQGNQDPRDSAPHAREVVVYVSTDEAIARPILDEFSARTGIGVRARYDSENSKTTALAAMLRQERESPRADVFWSGECFAATQLGREQVLGSWRSSQSDRFPDWLRGESGRWVGFAPRVRVLVYDPQRVMAQRLPSSVLALADPALGMRTGIADPRFGTTRGHVGALAALLDGAQDGAFAAWARGFAEGGGVIVSGGNAAVVDGVVRGELDLGLTDSDDYYAAVQGGARLSMVAIPQLPAGATGAGAMLVPNSVSLVQGAPHPAEADELIKFMLSDEVRIWLHASRSGNLLIPPVEPAAAPRSVAELPASLPLMDGAVVGQRIESVESPLEFEDVLVADAIGKAVETLRSAVIGKGDE